MTADPDARASALLDRMSLDEQIGLLHGEFPMRWKEKPDHVQPSAGYVPGLERLGIPALRETDASLGVAGAGRRDDAATALPCGLALAASWSTRMAEAAGAMIGAETRAKGFNVLLAGGVNLTREPRNGRNFEYLGEDPLLAGKLAGASIRGIQSNHVVSTAKHFAINSQETGRMVVSANIAEPGFRESDLLAFQIAIEDGRPGAIMSAYNRINGAYACDSAHLLTEVLRRDWNYPGWVMSDWGGVHSTVRAVNAGLDQQSGQQLDRERYYSDGLRAALDEGTVTPAQVRTMAHRIVRSMAACGLLDHPVSIGGPDLATGAKVALAAAERGIVLLKNDGVLPLGPEAWVAVIGGRADIGVLSGGGSSQVVPAGSTRLDPPTGAPAWSAGVIYHPDPPLAAIGSRVTAVWDDGTDVARAAVVAQAVDVAIVFATQWATEAVDTTLALDGAQDALIAAVAAANPARTVVVLETGNPVTMPWLDQVAAVVEAWYPGSQGGEAIARILFGETEPSGRLPITFPASTAQLPHPELPGADLPVGPPPLSNPPPFDVDYHEGSDVGYRWFARTGAKPLFPFGHGLSYTTFRYGGLEVTGRLSASFDVTNTGAREGVETAQLYLTASPGRTQQRLLGWARLALKPGETQRVAITAEPRLLADWSVEAHAFAIAAGRYDVFVGPDAATAALTGSAEVAGANLGP